MPKDNENALDFKQLYKLYDELAESNRSLARSMIQVERSIAEQTIIIRTFDKKHTEHDRRLDRHAKQIREVERKQDSCGAETQIKGLWGQIKRLNSFKDMIMDRSRDDSKVIDIHALRMEEMAAKDAAALRSTAIKWIPWLVVAFVLGIAISMFLLAKVVYGDTLIPLPDPPKVQLKTNLSSQGDTK